MIYSESTLSLDTNKLFLIDELRRDNDLLNKSLYELRRIITPSEIDKLELLSPDDDVLFSLYLLSLSLSYSSIEDISDSNKDNSRGIHSQTVTPGDIYLSTEEDPYLLGSINY